jgi:hypothetical protein
MPSEPEMVETAREHMGNYLSRLLQTGGQN